MPNQGTNGPDRSFTMKAAETTLAQYCAAVMDKSSGDYYCKRPTGAAVTDEVPIGILQSDEHAAGTLARYRMGDTTKMKISEAVTRGDTLVIADVQGRAKPKGSGTYTSGKHFLGVALTSATTANSLVDMLIDIPREAQS